MARTLEVKIVGDSSSLERAFAKANRSTAQFQRNTAKASKSTGFLKDFGKGAGISASIVGIATLGEAVHATFEEMANAQKVAAQTNAVLKSTGQVAGVTAQHVDDLALALLNKSGVDDEVIKSGENVLLTFTNIRNEAGKAGDIFDQATRAALDFSVRTGRSMDAASLAIGRALQDPAKAANALRRAQVVLTEAEQHAISVALKQGNTLKAQQLILQDLRKRYEGAAEAAGNTLPGKMNILREQTLNLSASLAQNLVPALTNTVDGLNKVVAALKKLGETPLPEHGSLGKTAGFLSKPIWQQAIDQFRTMGEMLGFIDQQASNAADSIQRIPRIVPPAGLEGPVGTDAHPVNITAAQRNQFRDRRLQRMIDRVQDIPTLQGQIKRLREIAKLVQQWVDAANDVTRKQTLQDDLLQIQRDILGDQAQIASDAAQAADDAKQKHEELIRKQEELLRKQKELAQKRREALVARQFGILGLGPTGEDPIPGMKALRRQLARVADRLKGTELDTRGNRSLLQRIRKALDFKTLEPEVRQKIRDLLAGIQDEFKQGGEHILRFRKLQPDAFIRSLGLDLSPAQRRKLRQGLAGIGPGGTVGAGSSAFALAGGVTFNGPVTFNGVHDVKTMEHELGKRSKARSHQRRGAR
jgi:hypothetical protein